MQGQKIHTMFGLFASQSRFFKNQIAVDAFLGEWLIPFGLFIVYLLFPCQPKQALGQTRELFGPGITRAVVDADNLYIGVEGEQALRLAACDDGRRLSLVHIAVEGIGVEAAATMPADRVRTQLVEVEWPGGLCSPVRVKIRDVHLINPFSFVLMDGINYAVRVLFLKRLRALVELIVVEKHHVLIQVNFFELAVLVGLGGINAMSGAGGLHGFGYGGGAFADRLPGFQP